MKREENRKETIIRVTIIFTFLLLFLSVVAAAPAKKLSVQGRLTNATDGSSLTGTYSINFSLWDASSGGTVQYSEVQSVTTDSNGLYSVVLTPSDESIFTNPLWLSLKVGSDAEMTPRINLTTAPYAYQALDLQCTDCIGGTEIEESGLSGTASGLTAGSANDLTCTDCIGPTEINDSYVLLSGDTMSGNLDMGNNLILNIGSTGTDFTSGGGLTVAGAFTASSTAALNGGTTLGDASSDSLTINSAAASIPNNLSFDSGTLFVDSTNDRVGVGTSSPGTDMEIKGNSGVELRLNTGTTDGIINISFWDSDSQVGGILWDDNPTLNIDANGEIKLRTHANTRLYIGENNGYVGIGTSSPSAKLHVYESNITENTLLNLSGDRVGDGKYALFASADIDDGVTSPNYYYPFYFTGKLSCDSVGCGTRTFFGNTALVKIKGTRKNSSESYFSGAGLAVDMTDTAGGTILTSVGIVSRGLTEGIRGISTKTSGTTYGVYGDVASPSGWGLYTPDNASVGGWLKIGTGSPENASGAGDLYVTSDIEYDGNLYGPGADLAERTPTSEKGLTSGTVVEIDPENPGKLRKSTSPYSKLVAGVVSTSPGIILGKDNQGVELAVTGRVPVMVNDENGPVKPGDLLTTSSTPGEAMACRSPEKCFGAILGKAMEPLECGEGMITALVTIG